MRPVASVKPRFFAKPSAFRAWLAKHHSGAAELLVGFHKKDSRKPSMTWPAPVDQALCFGWIDGVRRRLSYTIRFTPRRPRSVWSIVNIRRATELMEQGLMSPAGLAAFERRSEERSRIYAYEQRYSAVLAEEHQNEHPRNRPPGHAPAHG